MLVICVGLQRAASTLQYQLCREILKLNKPIIDYGYIRFENGITNAVSKNKHNEFSIIKTHNYFEIYNKLNNRDDVVFLTSYRDLRETSVSVMEAYDKTYEKLMKDRWLESEMNCFYKQKNLNNILFQEYNKLKNDLNNSIQQIAYFINVNLSDKSLAKIEKRFNRNAQLKKMNTYRTSKKYKIIFFINRIFNKINPTPYLQRGLILNIDNNSSLHHNHISVNNINWQSFFSKKQKAEIKTIIGNWLVEVGYEKDSNW